jgi:hypothetical protein
MRFALCGIYEWRDLFIRILIILIPFGRPKDSLWDDLKIGRKPWLIESEETTVSTLTGMDLKSSKKML